MAVASNEPVQIVSADSEHAVAAYRHVLVLCFGLNVSLEALRAVRKAHFATMARYPQGLGCLTVSSGTRVSDAPFSEAAQLVRDTYKNVRWSACVIQGEGFMVSASRAALTSLLTLTGQVSLVRAFRDLPSALSWQEKHASGLGIEATQLERIVNEALKAMR